MSALRSLAFTLSLLNVCIAVRAQVPTQCLEIERILVDACIDLTVCPGASEGQNEMVAFRTGPIDIALNELAADWPNNSWNGLVQDGTTATITATLNATIVGCGHLLEPPGGVIPAGSRVIMVTSTAMCALANPFTNLNDTVHLVFQAPGNTSGHFANHNNGGTISPTPVGASDLRTLVLTYLPTGCADTVSYDRSLLVNTSGSYGGVTTDNDGATAVFTWPGIPQVSYVNFGCQAPFVPNDIEIQLLSGSLCGGAGQVLVVATPIGPFSDGAWSGGTGTFSDPGSVGTTYFAGAGDTGDVTLTFTANFTCGDPVVQDFVIPAGVAPTVTITADGPTALCPGEFVVLTASGADSYLWNTQEPEATITVTQPGNYSVTGTNACGTGGATIDITEATGPSVTITPDGPTALCPGQSVVLTASGADTFLWSTLEVTTSITVSQPGTVTVTGTNACGEGTAQIDITLGAAPVVVIDLDGPNPLCPGDSAILMASGADSYLWSTQETSEWIVVDAAGTYTVTGTNGCGTDDEQVVVDAIAVTASFTMDPASGLAPLAVEFTNTSTPQSATFSWAFGDGAQSMLASPAHTYLDAGTYTVLLVATDQGCFSSATATITVDGIAPDTSGVSVPNIFTPNGDGVNDVLAPLTVNIASMDMEIINRWGQVVARLQWPRQVWDARTFAGEPAPDGTYFYVLKALGKDGRAHELKGTITLVR
ncbi:MAG: gliding motility-associated C-terminal domain-containing protein [Flavobacteriales bacterium]|nr:gliding motility-associated C-terminal domain-containing protein [Flavobacteriales bacterium]